MSINAPILILNILMMDALEKRRKFFIDQNKTSPENRLSEKEYQDFITKSKIKGWLTKSSYIKGDNQTGYWYDDIEYGAYIKKSHSIIAIVLISVSISVIMLFIYMAFAS